MRDSKKVLEKHKMFSELRKIIRENNITPSELLDIFSGNYTDEDIKKLVKNNYESIRH